MDLIIEAIGITGLVLMLSAFYLNNFKKKKVRRKTKTYNLINFLGASLLGIYSFLNGMHLFTILNLTWAIVALWFLLTIISQEQEHQNFNEILR